MKTLIGLVSKGLPLKFLTKCSQLGFNFVGLFLRMTCWQKRRVKVIKYLVIG